MRKVGQALLVWTGLLAGAGVAAATSAPGAPQMVADLGASQELNNYGTLFAPVPVVAVGDHWFFGGNDGVHGAELWSSDGTNIGTSMVKDVCPGDCPGIVDVPPEEMASLGCRVFFEASDGVTGEELWESDGTANGTHQVADLMVEPGLGSSPSWLTPFGDRLLFVAQTASESCSLLSLLEGGTVPEVLATFPSRPTCRDVGDLTVLDNHVVFSATTPELGREPWITDGTLAGTLPVLDIAPGAQGSIAGGTARVAAWSLWLAAEGRVFFPADDGAHGLELWSTDGTAAGTTMVADLEPGNVGSSPWRFAAVGDRLLFDASTTTYPGNEIWSMPLDLSAPPAALGITGFYLGQTSVGAFLAASGDPTVGEELFLTNGTAAGTHLVHDVYPGSLSGLIFALGTISAFVENDRILFVGYDTHGFEMWTSDGTDDGTHIVRDVNPGAASFLQEVSSPPPTMGALPDGRHVVFGTDGVHGREPWVTDGLGTDLTLLADTDQQTSINSCSPQSCADLTSDGTHVAFGAMRWPEGDTGLGWIGPDGQGGLVRPAAIPTESQWVLRWPAYGHDDTAWLDGVLFFPAGVDSTNDQTWVSDGTNDGTHPLSDTVPLIPQLQPDAIASHFGLVYLAFSNYATTPATYSLWHTDGSAGGTQNIGAYSLAVSPTDHDAPVSSFLLFSHGDGSETLLQLDDAQSPPSALVTVPGHGWSAVAEIPHGPGDHRLLLLVQTDDGWPSSGGKHLWSWTQSAGLQLLTDHFVAPMDVSDFRTSLAPPVAVLGNEVVFVATDPTHGAEPWITDGTPLGTKRLADINPGALGSAPRWFLSLDSKVLFSAFAPGSGREIWSTDGTTTALALDATPGTASSNPSFLRAHGDRVFFSANSPTMGVELFSWDTLGPDGAQLVGDILPGPDSSSPTDLTWVSSQLYFFANDGTHGLELWRVAASGDLFADDFEHGDLKVWNGGAAPVEP